MLTKNTLKFVIIIKFRVVGRKAPGQESSYRAKTQPTTTLNPLNLFTNRRASYQCYQYRDVKFIIYKLQKRYVYYELIQLHLWKLFLIYFVIL